MKSISNRKCEQNQWSQHFRHVKDDAKGRPSFYIKGSREHLWSYDSFFGDHKILSDVQDLCICHQFPETFESSDSPMNVVSREWFYEFLDGGLEIIQGNYFFGGQKQGAYIRGFNALRWVVSRLSLTQPRKFVGESLKPGYQALDDRVYAKALFRNLIGAT